jgi:ABC transporter substrate binding protein
MPVIGFLGVGSRDNYVPYVAAFRKGLDESGFVEDQNVAIEYRWAEGQYDRMAELAAELVRRQVAVIAVPGSPPGARAAKAATSTIPIVFEQDAQQRVERGLQYGAVASNRITGGPRETSVPQAVRPCPRGFLMPPPPRRVRSGHCH